jgi:hypothetical protein
MTPKLPQQKKERKINKEQINHQKPGKCKKG